MSFFFNIVALVLQLFSMALLARALLSWLPDVDRNNPIIRILYDVTEPILRPVREMLPQTGMMDWSPFLVFVLIQVVIRVLSVIR